MTAEEIDAEIARKRWAAYPLLVRAVEEVIVSYASAQPTNEDHNRVDRAVQLLILLGERKQIAPSCFVKQNA